MHPRNARDAASSGPNMERDPVALALIDHLERSFGSEPRWSVRDGGRLLWSPHHLAVEVSVRPRPGADGTPVYVVTSTVEIAFGLDASRYLPMLARHARRLDAVAALTMSDDGRTTTAFEHVLHPGPEQPARIQAIRDRVAIQALQSEALLLLAQVEGVVGDANLPPERGPSPGLLDRPADERNEIETQAVSALEHLADCVLVLVDPSETCGYTLEDQLELRDQVASRFAEVPVLTVCNKADLSREVEADRYMSVTEGENVEGVLDAAVEAIGYEPGLPFEE